MELNRIKLDNIIIGSLREACLEIWAKSVGSAEGYLRNHRLAQAIISCMERMESRTLVKVTDDFRLEEFLQIFDI